VNEKVSNIELVIAIISICLSFLALILSFIFSLLGYRNSKRSIEIAFETYNTRFRPHLALNVYTIEKQNPLFKKLVDKIEEIFLDIELTVKHLKKLVVTNIGNGPAIKVLIEVHLGDNKKTINIPDLSKDSKIRLDITEVFKKELLTKEIKKIVLKYEDIKGEKFTDVRTKARTIPETTGVEKI
jgi:hypothetical protein